MGENEIIARQWASVVGWDLPHLVASWWPTSLTRRKGRCWLATPIPICRIELLLHQPPNIIVARPPSFRVQDARTYKYRGCLLYNKGAATM